MGGCLGTGEARAWTGAIAMNARTPAATEVPLDDGRRNGTEHWRDLDGVRFCHWDRWLLRLALDEPNGLRSIAETFQGRRSRGSNADAEAMLAQLADLKMRLSQLRCEPKDVLDEIERSSQWHHNKAFRRVWHSTIRHATEAMMRTPRNVLEARAREGNWSAFPVSPAAYVARLRPIYHHGHVDWRGVGSVVLLLRIEGERMLANATRDEELAVRRAIVGAVIEAMAHADDSCDELGQHFRDAELAYLDHLGDYIDRPGILRDLPGAGDMGGLRAVPPHRRVPRVATRVCVRRGGSRAGEDHHRASRGRPRLSGVQRSATPAARARVGG